MHLLSYLYEDYHDARSLENKVLKAMFYEMKFPMCAETRCLMQGEEHSIIEELGTEEDVWA